MNEQELADLFSEQVDRMLQGESVTLPPDADGLQELLDFIGRPTAQTQFEASPAAQSAFQSQMAHWSGPVNGGSPVSILGLSKIWFISIIVTVIIAVGGLSLITVIATTVFIFSAGETVQTTVTPGGTMVSTGTPPATPGDDDDDEGTPVVVITTTAVITPITPIPVTTTVTPVGTPGLPPASNIFFFYFQTNLTVPTLCQGAYTTQQILVNSGPEPVDNAALTWEIIDGADFVETVNVSSPAFEAVSGDGAAAAGASPVISPSLASFANFDQISVQEEIKLDVKVKVNDKWWKQPDGTKIKVKVKIKSEIDVDIDDDDANYPSQTVIIVKQGTQWITLSGVAHTYGQQALLVNGNMVVLNNCTGLPPQLPPGSNVEVVGILMPDGTFIAINITIINITIITGDFDSGVPTGGGGSGGSDGGGSKGGGGNGGGGSGGNGGSGGSRGGGSRGGS